MKKFLIFTMMLLCMAFSASAQSSSAITEEQAIEIAQQEVIKRGGSLENVERVHAFFDNELGFWVVSLDGKPTSTGGYQIGNDAAVIVSPDGENVKFIPAY